MHRSRVQILQNGTPLAAGRVMTQCNWWNRSIVVVRIDGQDFYMGEASGWEHNCMIYTLQQCSDATLTCDVAALRKLEQQHEGSTTP